VLRRFGNPPPKMAQLGARLMVPTDELLSDTGG
jgi:hypothetical protein